MPHLWKVVEHPGLGGSEAFTTPEAADAKAGEILASGLRSSLPYAPGVEVHEGDGLNWSRVDPFTSDGFL